MKAEEFRLNDPFEGDNKLMAITILILTFDKYRVIVTWNRIFIFVGALPSLLSYNGFGHVVNIIDWAHYYLTCLKVKSSEY
jgi:hypothetical protein